MTFVPQRSLCPDLPGQPEGSCTLRPFGTLGEDLLIDFAQDPPHLVTRLLAACMASRGGEPLPEDLLWDLSVGKRIQLLLALSTLTFGRDHEFQRACTGCGEPMEVIITDEELADLQAQGEALGESITVPADREHPALRFRRPTGRDQLDWQSGFQQTGFQSNDGLQPEEAFFTAMIRGLSLSSEPALELSPQRLQAIEAAFETADPLVHFSLTTACPECHREQIWPLDLLDQALRDLYAARDRLLWVVHRLASTYHWDEERILNLPPSRREEYLALIEKELVS